MGKNSGEVVASRPLPKSLLSHVRYEHLAAGMLGGCASTLMLHPLDLLKIRFAVDDGKGNRPEYRGLVHAFRSITRKDGFIGLYRGVTPNVAGAGAAWGLYFLFYSSIKNWMLGDSRTPLGPGKHMLAAAESGILTLALTNPIWVVKTRLCLQYDKAVDTGSHRQYRGMLDAFTKVYRYEGVGGLYKGFVPGLFGVSHGALQFMVYEELKKVYCAYKSYAADAKLNTLEYLFFAALSKLFAASVTYPYQVLRSRLQDQHANYGGVMDVVTRIWRYEGFKGLYKGFSPYMVHVMPSICIVFLTYEYVTNRGTNSNQFEPVGARTTKRITVDSNIAESKLPVFMISETISSEEVPSPVATVMEEVKER